MKKYLLLVAAVAALVSCTSDFIQPEAPEQEIPEQGQDAPEVENLQEVLIYANAPKSGSDQSEESSSQEQELPETRTQLVNGTDVRWSAEDVVKVCFPAYTGGWDSYKTWRGQSALFTSVGTDGGENAVFKGTWSVVSELSSNGFIIYPETVEFSSSYKTSMGNYPSNTITYTIPDVQTAVDNSFAPNLNLSYAPVTKTAMDNNEVSVSFKNLCGLVKVKLPEEDYDIVSITLESTNTGGSGILCGKANLSFSNGAVGISTYPTNTPTITLKREDNSELTPGASYYAVVWPTRTHAGLKFTFTDANGNEAEKQTPDNGETYTFNAGQYHTFNISSLSFNIAPRLNVSTNSITPKARGSNESFFVTANNAWSTSKTDSPWLTLVEDQEANTVELTATENTTPYERTATITVTSADLSETITVTQPPVYYRSSTGTPITAASDLEDGALYMIYFATGSQNNQIDTYCWKIDNDGNVLKNGFADRTAKATNDCVFKFYKTSRTSWQSYHAVASGYLQSEYNGKYQVSGGATILDFAGASTSDAVELIFGNQWFDANSNSYEQGSDIDIWNSSSSTIYWNGNSLAWGSTGNAPRKWFFVKVTEVE